MAKFLCVCGEAIRTSGEIPHPYELRILRDREIPDDGLDLQAIERAARFGYECPRCSHLWIFWEGVEEGPTGYAPLPK